MTFASKETLDEVEPVEAAHYFGVVETAIGPLGSEVMEPVYGLIDARYPDSTEPVDVDNTRLMVVEDVAAAKEGYAQKLATLLFTQESPDDQNPVARVVISFTEPTSESEVNPLVENPGHAAVVIEEAARHLELERVQVDPEDVVGVQDRYLDAASFLLNARKLTRVSGNVFELATYRGRPSAADAQASPASDSDQELLAAA